MDALSLLAQSKLVNPISGDMISHTIALSGTPSITSFQYQNIWIEQSHYGLWTQYIEYKLNGSSNMTRTMGNYDKQLVIGDTVCSSLVDLGKWSYIHFNGKSAPRSSSATIEKSILFKYLQSATYYVGESVYSSDHSCDGSVRFNAYVGVEANNTGKIKVYLRYSISCPYSRCGSFSHNRNVDSQDTRIFTIPWPTSIDIQLEY